MSRNKKFVGGFDLSLTSTGVVILDDSGIVKERHVVSFPKLRGAERLHHIYCKIKKIISNYELKLVCIEGYSMGSKGKTYHIGELGGLIRWLLYRHGIKYVEPKPTQLKKYATGKGGGVGGSKDQVTLFCFKNWNFEATDNNEADAMVLAQIALALTTGNTKLTQAQTQVIKTINNPVIKKKKGSIDNND